MKNITEYAAKEKVELFRNFFITAITFSRATIEDITYDDLWLRVHGKAMKKKPTFNNNKSKIRTPRNTSIWVLIFLSSHLLRLSSYELLVVVAYVYMYVVFYFFFFFIFCLNSWLLHFFHVCFVIHRPIVAVSVACVFFCFVLIFFPNSFFIGFSAFSFIGRNLKGILNEIQASSTKT